MIGPAFDIAQLTAAERLELIEVLWDSLRAQPHLLPFTQADAALVDARRAEHRRDPDAAVPWEQVRVELLADQAAEESADEQHARSEATKRGA